MDMIRLRKAQEDRQAALDYINANPGALGPNITAALGWKAASGAGRLEHIVMSLGELRREPAEFVRVNCNGVAQKQQSFAYYALVKTTKSAEEVFESIRGTKPKSGKTSKAKAEPEKARAFKPAKWTKRGFRNTQEGRPCTPSCGGQGATINHAHSADAWGL